MRSGSTICMATALSRNMHPTGEPAKRSLRFEGNHRASRLAPASFYFPGQGSRPTHRGAVRILYRDFHQARADERRQALLDSLDADGIDTGYSSLKPNLRLGLPFVPTAVCDDWFDWPALPDLFPVSFPGVKTSRDGFLVDIDLDRLRSRVYDYFDADLSHEEITRRYPGVMKKTGALRCSAKFAPHCSRAAAQIESANFLRYAYRPFDNRWLYWDADTKSCSTRPRADYRPHVFPGNTWLEVLQNGKART